MRSSIPAILRSMPARRLLLLHQRHHGAARVVSSRRPGYAIQFDSERVASLECSGPQDACEILVHALQALVEVDSLNNERLEAARVRLHTPGRPGTECGGYPPAHNRRGSGRRGGLGCLHGRRLAGLPDRTAQSPGLYGVGQGCCAGKRAYAVKK